MCVDVYLCMEQRETRIKSDCFFSFSVFKCLFELLCLCLRNGYLCFDFFAQITKGEEQTRVLAEDQKKKKKKHHENKGSEHQQRGSKHTDPILPSPHCAGGTTHDSVYKAINP